VDTKNGSDAREDPGPASADPYPDYRAAFETAPLGILFLDAEGRVLSANPEAERILGLPLARMRGRAAADLDCRFLREDGAPLEDEACPFAAALRTGLPAAGIVVGISGPGGKDLRWLSVSATPLVRPGESRPFQVMASLLDITDRLRTEKRLRESEEKARVIFEHSPIGILRFDQEGVIIDCNKLFGEIIGTPEAQLIGLHMQGLPDRKIVAALRQALAGNIGSYEGVYQSMTSGKRTPVRVLFAPMAPDGGHVRGGVALIEDITERMEAERTLREREERYRAFFDHGPDGVVILDPVTARIVEFNDQACLQLGYTREEFGRLSMGDIDAESMNDEILERIQQIIRKGHDDFEVLHRTKHGELRNVHVTAQVIQVGGVGTYHCVWRDVTSRKEVENALRESERKLNQLVDNLPGFAYQGVDAGGWTMAYLSEGFREITGYRPELFIGNLSLAYNDLILPSHRQAIRKTWDQVLADHSIFEEEYPITTASGAVMWIWERGRGIYDEEGRLQCVEGFATDISYRKRVEEALRASETQFRSYIDNSPIGVFICDEKGRYLQVNPAAEAITGYARTELMSMGMADLLPLEALESGAEHIRNLVETGHAIDEFGFRRKDGHQGYWSVESVRLSPIRFLSFASDITERKRAELALQKSERFLRDAQTVGRIGCYSLDLTLGIWESSETLDDIFGIGKDYPRDVHGWLDLVAADAREDHRRYMLETIQDRRGFDQEFRIVRRSDAQERWISGLGVLEFDEEGQTVRLIGTMQDITDRKRAEDERRQLQSQLHQAQKMESLGLLAGGIAHDMNNVLGAILILASSSLETQPEGSPNARAFGTIIKATERGGRMLKGLLSFARQTPAEERELDMNAIFREEVRLLERTTFSRIRLQMDLAPDLKPVRGDASALTNALMNLCLNAVDAMQENGTLTFRTRNQGAGWIEIQVEDTGCGMPKEILEKALDPFFTTKPEGKGTGLGLSMAYNTVKAHRGTLEIQSRPGTGTLVKMRLPVCEAAALSPEAEDAQGAPGASHVLRVLLVDDDELIQTSLQALLRDLGHTVTPALSGEEALAQLEAGLQADVVILDINMPGLGGAGTLRRLRSLRPAVPVLLTTGRANQASQNLAEAYAKVTLLTKPFSVQELRQYLEGVGRA